MAVAVIVAGEAHRRIRWLSLWALVRGGEARSLVKEALNELTTTLLLLPGPRTDSADYPFSLSDEARRQTLPILLPLSLSSLPPSLSPLSPSTNDFLHPCPLTLVRTERKIVQARENEGGVEEDREGFLSI